MEINNTVPKIEKIAILLIIAFVINILYATLSKPLLTNVMGVADYGQYLANVSVATFVNLAFTYVLHIIISVWTYNEAKKQNERPWTWAAFALFFGLIAVVAFYLILVIYELRSLKEEAKSNQKNGNVQN